MVKLDIRLKKLFFILVLGALILFAFGCKTAGKKPQEVTFRDNRVVLTEWQDVFEYRGVVPFSFGDPDKEIFSVGDMEINNVGEFIIPDGKARKIMLFDSSGKFLHDIGGQGEGPGEFMIPLRLFLDKDQHLYVFDAMKRMFIKYSFPGYGYTDQIRLNEFLDDSFIDGENDFIVYKLGARKNKLLFKFDYSGKIIASSFPPKQEKLSVFLGRFSIGRIVDIPGTGFLFLYPEEYKVYLMSYDLEVKKVLTAEKPSRYYPDMGDFPAQLSPYEFTKNHLKWLGKSLLPSLVFYLGDDIFITVLFEGYKSGNRYVNVHDLEGNTYARGLLVPFSGWIPYARNGELFVKEDSTFDEKGDVLPLKLHRYKLKDLKRPFQ